MANTLACLWKEVSMVSTECSSCYWFKRLDLRKSASRLQRKQFIFEVGCVAAHSYFRNVSWIYFMLFCSGQEFIFSYIVSVVTRCETNFCSRRESTWTQIQNSSASSRSTNKNKAPCIRLCRGWKTNTYKYFTETG